MNLNSQETENKQKYVIARKGVNPTAIKFRENTPSGVIPDAIFLQIFDLDREISFPGSRTDDLLR